MRQFTPAANLLLTCLAATGLVVCLGLPWYGAAPSVSDASQGVGTIAGPIDSTAALVSRWFTAEGSLGTEVLTPFAQRGLMGLALVSVLLALAMLAPSLRRLAREGLHVVPLAAPAFVVLHMIDQPGAGGLELRWGILAALAAGLLMASSAWHGAAMRLARPAPKAYVPPTAPNGSTAPPG